MRNVVSMSDRKKPTRQRSARSASEAIRRLLAAVDKTISAAEQTRRAREALAKLAEQCEATAGQEHQEATA
jgi:hypothetical protein